MLFDLLDESVILVRGKTGRSAPSPTSAGTRLARLPRTPWLGPAVRLPLPRLDLQPRRQPAPRAADGAGAGSGWARAEAGCLRGVPRPDLRITGRQPRQLRPAARRSRRPAGALQPRPHPDCAPRKLRSAGQLEAARRELQRVLPLRAGAPRIPPHPPHPLERGSGRALQPRHGGARARAGHSDRFHRPGRAWAVPAGFGGLLLQPPFALRGL